ncbi:MAG TPA: hypothetical protein VIG80_03785 [Bacillaceae bacterium]
MDTVSATELLEKLRNGELNRIEVPKEDFLPFRQVLMEQSDVKQFRGIAQRGGNVIYEYQK